MKELQAAFAEFTGSYLKQDAEYDINIKLKIEHSQRVAILSETIAMSEVGLDKEIAFISALLHDIGRFEQYHLYQSFDDNVSENHGELGYKVL